LVETSFVNDLHPVLILAGTPRVVQSIARCLNQHGIAVDVGYSNSFSSTGFTSRSVRNICHLPEFSQTEGFRKALLDLVNRHHYDMLVPTTDEALLAIAPVYREIREMLYPGCPPPQIVNSVLDKQLTLQAAVECGIVVPSEYRLRNLDDLERERDSLRFPLIAKPASKATGLKFALRYFRNFDQLREVYLAHGSPWDKYLLQEYCSGFGIGVEILMWGGRVHAVFQHRRLRELRSTGGASVLAEAQAPEPALVEISVKLLRRLQWQGVAMVEFRYDPTTGRATLMEVNGRYWGSLPLSVNAGVEFPYYEWQLAHGCQEPGPIASYGAGFRTLWRTGDLMRFVALMSDWKRSQLPLRELCREGFGLALRFCSLTPDAIWSWGDPKPALQEFYAQFVTRVLRPVVRFLLAPIQRHAP
jgi:predicted ATP-grasp superfamily ATP-dependent carboligase